MKKLVKVAGFISATIVMLALSQSSAFAADRITNNNSSLSGMEVIGGLVILLAVIIFPIIKSKNENRQATEIIKS